MTDRRIHNMRNPRGGADARLQTGENVLSTIEGLTTLLFGRLLRRTLLVLVIGLGCSASVSANDEKVTLPPSGAQESTLLPTRSLTKEQLAQFPEGATVDARLWRMFSAPVYGWMGKRAESRTHQRFSRGVYRGVCLDFHINEELYAGRMMGGCAVQPIHKRHPRGKKFSFVAWERLDPLENLEIVRNIFLSKQSVAPVAFQDSSIKNSYWLKVAPIIQRLLARNDGVQLSRARLDLDADGSAETIYALGLSPRDQCLVEGARSEIARRYLHIEDQVSFRDSFNTALFGGDPIFYDGKLYFASRGHIARPVVTPDDEFLFASQCEFQEVRKRRSRQKLQ